MAGISRRRLAICCRVRTASSSAACSSLLAATHSAAGTTRGRLIALLRPHGGLRTHLMCAWTNRDPELIAPGRAMLQGGREAEVREQLGEHIGVQTGDQAAVGLQHLYR